MSIDDVHVRWNGKRQFVGWDAAGHGVVMDASTAYGGEGTGARPIELVLYALAGCTGMDVISILEKKRQNVAAFMIEVNGEQREDEYPKIYTRITVTYIVTGPGIDPAAVARAIELSEEKYCTVRGMLGREVEVVTDYRVVDAAAATASNAGE